MPLGVPKEVAVAISLLLFGHIRLTSVGGGLWLMEPAAYSSPANRGPVTLFGLRVIMSF